MGEEKVSTGEMSEACLCKIQTAAVQVPRMLPTRWVSWTARQAASASTTRGLMTERLPQAQNLG